MASIAKVVVEISLDREFDYRIPAHLQVALEWVVERQAVTTDKKSGIVNDANP